MILLEVDKFISNNSEHLSYWVAFIIAIIFSAIKLKKQFSDSEKDVYNKTLGITSSNLKDCFSKLSACQEQLGKVMQENAELKAMNIKLKGDLNG